MPDTIDGSAEEIPVDEHATPATTAVVRRERRSEVIRPFDTDELVASFTAYQEMLPRLLTDDDYQVTGTDRNGKVQRFVKKSGWRKIAAAFDLDVQILRSSVERDENGHPIRAEVWARAIAPSGRSMDGDGYCEVSESRFAKAAARQKLENDLRATATTRAMNRAISGLVGMGDVSAEEMDTGSVGSDVFNPPLPTWANPASVELTNKTRDALNYMLDNDTAAAGALMGKIISDTDGELVAAVGRALLFAAHAITHHANPAPEEQAPANALLGFDEATA